LACDNSLQMLRSLALEALDKELEANKLERQDVDLQFGRVRRIFKTERGLARRVEFSVRFYDDETFSDCSSIERNVELFVTVSRRDSGTDGRQAPPLTRSACPRYLNDTKPRLLESVSECLEAYESREATDSCSMTCRECGTEPDLVVEQMSVLRTPQILTLHIDRDNVTDEDDGKSNRMVKYPINDALKFKGDLYDLFGVVVHRGLSTDGGHYTAKVKSLCDGNWYKMNDSCGPVQLTSMKPDRNATVLMFEKRP